MRTRKDWDAICRDLSSGEDSDEHDSLNVVKVQRNAHRVAELMRTVVLGDETTTPPKGMNRADVIRNGLGAAIDAASPRSRDPTTSASEAEVEETAPRPADGRTHKA